MKSHCDLCMREWTVDDRLALDRGTQGVGRQCTDERPYENVCHPLRINGRIGVAVSGHGTHRRMALLAYPPDRRVDSFGHDAHGDSAPAERQCVSSTRTRPPPRRARLHRIRT